MSERARCHEEVAAAYHARRDRFEAQRARLARRSRRFSATRLATFGGAVVGFGAAWWLRGAPQATWLAWAGGLCVAAFAVLVVLHELLERRIRRVTLLRELNAAGLLRLERDWDALPRAGAPADAAPPPLARDLDLLGHASLWHLLGAPSTPYGKVTLERWLLEPAEPDEVGARQRAVAELAPLVDWRQQLAVQGHLLADLPPDPERFLRWAEGEPWLCASPVRVWLPRALAAAGLGLVISQAAGWLAGPYWLAVVLVNLVVGGTMMRRIHRAIDELGFHEREFSSYAELFAHLAAASSFSSPRLAALRDELAADSGSAVREMRRLARLLGVAEVRRMGLIYLPLQLLLLWDCHVFFFLERWQARAGRRARAWLAALGEVEALAALSGLRHDHPTWVFPEPSDERTPSLSARALGHPLLHPVACVTNDVALAPEQPLLLVTGSNMSGKSTLLRALGANVALAQAGGPVFARALCLPPVTLGTSFRVDDSLSDGVSYFMAELLRVKQIVARAADARGGGRRLLFLLDEILLGTNIVERQIAVRRLVARLLDDGALGAVATHDLSLAEAEELRPRCRAVHFRESFDEGADGPTMRFDYRLREGVSPTTNALKLLELVGLSG